MEPIRILHEDVIMDPGGIETQLMRIYRNIDRTKVQFDFLVHRTQKGAYDDEILSLGGRIFHAKPFNPFHYAAYYRSMLDFFKAHPEYKIMIAHTELALGPLMCAKKAGIPMRICYSHNGQFAFSLKRCFMDFERLFLKRYCTDMFAVSNLAARYTFGEQEVDSGRVRIIQNGIEMDDFCFQQETRDRIRKEYGLEDKLVVGQVGRFMTQKNQGFLLDVFAQMYHHCPNARLLLIGEGELEGKLREQAKALGISQVVTFLGRQSNVNDWMKAMDILLLPSLWEGFPNVAIEAQASALPVYMSENITEEAVFSPYGCRLPLDKDIWVQRILEDLGHPLPRVDMSQTLLEKGCDVKATAKWYEGFYLEQFERLFGKAGVL